MDDTVFQNRLAKLVREHRALIKRKNEIDPGWDNGLFERYRDPVLTAAHVPLTWRYDFNPDTNPFLMERLGINAVFNPGAIELDGKILLVVRVEGVRPQIVLRRGRERERRRRLPLLGLPGGHAGDRGSGHQRVRHAPGPARGRLDLRRVLHRAQGSRRAARATSSAPWPRPASPAPRTCVTWERLPDLKTRSPQQRNVVLHPEFVDGQYAFYTRPQDDFIEAGTGGGIGWGLCDEHEPGGDRRGDRHRRRASTTPSRRSRTARGRRRSRRRRAGCTSPTGCATPPPGCATCCTPS